MRHGKDGTVLSAFLISALIVLASPAVAASDTPRLPCPAGTRPSPDYADADQPPAVAAWRDAAASEPESCGSRLQGRLDVITAVAGKVRFTGSVDDLAERAGAISETVGMLYWSTTDQDWRELVSDAAALQGPDANNRDWTGDATRRPDFSAAEMQSGVTLWFRQNDTRSTGDNLYSMRVLEKTPDRLVLDVVNESPIRFAFIERFAARALVSLHVIDRLGDGNWAYYGLAGLRGDPDAEPASLINRTAAFFRFLQGRKGDDAPPLAK
ncbi:DUF6675 family protein [Hwanghaeella sp.]|uniref:DUF6675 family protein n=1 Tax=Hwanghaeella sp. TaxID=2605943 RepID=UPI003CCBDF0B